MTSFQMAGLKRSEYAIPTLTTNQGELGSSSYAAEHFYESINEQLKKKKANEASTYASERTWTGAELKNLVNDLKKDCVYKIAFVDNFLYFLPRQDKVVELSPEEYKSLSTAIGIDTDDDEDDELLNVPSLAPRRSTSKYNIGTAWSRTCGTERSATANTAASRTMVTAELRSDTAYTAASRTMVTGEERSDTAYTAASRTMVTGEEKSDTAVTAWSRTLVTGEERSDIAYTAASRTMITGEEKSDTAMTACSRTLVTGEEMSDLALTAVLDSRSTTTANEVPTSFASNVSLVEAQE